MRWPWVSRALLDAVDRDNARLVERLLAQLAEARALVDRYAAIADEAVRRYHDVAERALAMRKEGFAPIEPPPPPPQEAMPQEVEAAIGERAVTPELDRHLRRWARQELTAMPPDKVAKRILEGVAEHEEEEL